jgi:ABC-2 type transport system ATP-binding protein
MTHDNGESATTGGTGQTDTHESTGGAGLSGSDRQTRRRFLQGTAVLAAGVTMGTGTAAATTGFSTADYTVESFDGTEIETTLYDPGDGPNPAVLMTHGWGAFRQSPLTVPKAAAYANAGYTVLTYDSRGFGGTSGTVGLDGPKETQDARELITWLANRPEVATEGADNPKIGMDGLSYAGGIQFQVAAADDRLDAIVPRITWNDLTYSLAPNGVIKDTWLTILLGLGTLGTVDGDDGSEVTDDLYDWYLESVWDNEVPDEALQAFRDRSAAYKDDLDTPAFLVQGWDDTLFKPNEAVWTYRQLQDAGVDTRLAFYEGGHAVEEIAVPLEAREYMNDYAIDWMDKHVRDQDPSIPQVHSWIKQEDSFRTDAQWPPEGVTPTTYSLGDADRDGDNRIERWSWWYEDSVSYTWTIDSDLEIVGAPEFDLTFDVEENEARIFFNLQKNGEAINDVGEAYRIPSAGRQRIQFSYPPLQRYFSPGDELTLDVHLESSLYAESRVSEGVTVDPGASTVTLPQRPR